LSAAQARGELLKRGVPLAVERYREGTLERKQR
jgi:hypothetical protein